MVQENDFSEKIIGKCESMRRVFQLIRKASVPRKDFLLGLYPFTCMSVINHGVFASFSFFKISLHKPAPGPGPHVQELLPGPGNQRPGLGPSPAPAGAPGPGTGASGH